MALPLEIIEYLRDCLLVFAGSGRPGKDQKTVSISVPDRIELLCGLLPDLVGVLCHRFLGGGVSKILRRTILYRVVDCLKKSASVGLV